MLEKINIKNYKSIFDDTIELSNVNVFIGENGCGKTNILEAVAMLSAAADGRVRHSELHYDKGVRIAKPELTVNAFSGKNDDTISYNVNFDNEKTHKTILTAENGNIKSDWVDIVYFQIELLSEQVEKKVKRGLSNHLNHVEDPELVNISDLNSQFTKEDKEILKAKRDINLISVGRKEFYDSGIENFLIYTLNTPALRGITNESKVFPVGLNGEGLDNLLDTLDKEQIKKLNERLEKITWFGRLVLDKQDILKVDGHKLGRSLSKVYFTDKFLNKKNNIFSAENANEGVLHLLFYYAALTSNQTPKIFGIDNIESSLNPKLCRTMMKEVAELAIENDRQVLITTHNPAILDGLNLHDDRQRLFTVYRNEKGHTKTRRITMKPEQGNDERRLMLSEMWMRGLLGAVPQHF